MNLDQYERTTVYPPTDHEPAHVKDFKQLSGNENYRTTKLTYVALGLIILFAAQGLMGDQSEFLKNLNEGLRIFTYIFTMLTQWIMFGIIAWALYSEGTGLRGAGFERLKAIDFSWGFALLLSLFAVGTAAGWLLTQIGLPPKGEIALILPQELTGKILWVFC